MMEQPVARSLDQAPTVDRLPAAAEYFPLANGRYEVKPGLFRWGTDFGNGNADQQVFQLDHSVAHYRQMKQQARAEALPKYYQTHQYGDDVAQAIAHFIIHRLVTDHPHHFHLTPHGDGCTLHNQLTQETLHFTADYQLQRVDSPDPVTLPPYQDSLDALALQVQEDLAVVSREVDRHWISAIHLCFPNHWAAATKIGQPFAIAHAPVPGMTAMNQRSDAIVHMLITRPPTVRFAWGVSTDTRLNHHPEPPDGIAIADWQGRAFDPAHPRLYLRIERQVCWGLPAVNAFLFTIRTSFRDVQALKRDPVLRSQLGNAVRSMSPAALAYKGLATQQTEILHWLEHS